MSVVVARGLTKRFGEFEAVRGVDVEVRKRECFGFLGPNGAGKTTTMRMISCTSPPTDGELSVLGLPSSRGRDIRRRMGVVPQENNLDEEVSVVENLLIYARYFDIPRRVAAPAAEELLRFVALQDKRDWRIDPQARHLVWEKLRSLKRQGVTLVLTTHYMDEAAQLCDRLVIMHEGRILIEGPPRELVARETSPQVIEVFEPDEDAGRGLRDLADLAERVERLADRWLFYTADGDALLAKVRGVVPDPGSVWLRGATLEDVFLQLTGRGLLE